MMVGRSFRRLVLTCETQTCHYGVRPWWQVRHVDQRTHGSPRTPNKSKQTTPPTTDIDRPQMRRLRKSLPLSTVLAAVARHRAPKRDRGEVSTRWDPTQMDVIRYAGSPPPIFAMTPGTMGRNIGRTTPEELEYAEMIPLNRARKPLTVIGLEIVPMDLVMMPRPPAASMTLMIIDIPPTMMMTPMACF